MVYFNLFFKKKAKFSTVREGGCKRHLWPLALLLFHYLSQTISIYALRIYLITVKCIISSCKLIKAAIHWDRIFSEAAFEFLFFLSRITFLENTFSFVHESFQKKKYFVKTQVEENMEASNTMFKFLQNIK